MLLQCLHECDGLGVAFLLFFAVKRFFVSTKCHVRCNYYEDVANNES